MADTVTVDPGSEKRCYTVKEIQTMLGISIVFQRTVLMNGWIDRQRNR